MSYKFENGIYYWLTDSGDKIPVDIKVPQTRMRRHFFRPFIVRAMEKLGKSKIDKNNPYTRKAKEWKENQKIKSLSLKEIKSKTKNKKIIVEQKVDGQTALMDYDNGRALFASLGGRIHTNLPVLNEIEKILGNRDDIHQAVMVGELAAVEDGKIVPFKESESFIKNPDKDKNKLHWYPYQILELNDEKIDDNFETYMKYWLKLKDIFDNTERIHPVKDFKDIDKAWKDIVEKEKGEGLIVRDDDNNIYKVKPTYFYDLVIIAVGDKKGKNWPKDKISNTLMAFMDKDKIFRTAGEVGTGWTDEQREELFDWAKDHKVSEDDTYVWVEPKKIAEIKWERSNIKENPAYRYENKKYKSVGKKIVGTIVKPVFVRYREDKEVKPSDLRLEQIPDWGERKASKILNFQDFMKRHIEILNENPIGDEVQKPQDMVELYELYKEKVKEGDKTALKYHKKSKITWSDYRKVIE